MQRPEFDSIKDYAEFSKYYWYRDELIKICKAHGLKAEGGSGVVEDSQRVGYEKEYSHNLLDKYKDDMEDER